MTATTYATVQETFGRVYQQLREDSGEDAPDSSTWYAATLSELNDDVRYYTVGREDLSEADVTAEIGGPAGRTIAWVYESSGRNLYRITDGASENALIDLFGRCLGYDL